MKRTATIVVCACLLASAAAQPLVEAPPTRSAAYGREFGAALGGIAACGVSGLLWYEACGSLFIFAALHAVLTGDDTPVAVVGYTMFGGFGALAAAAPAVAGFCTWRTGEAAGKQGKAWAAVVGAYVAVPAGIGLVALGYKVSRSPHRWYHGLPCWIPAAAVVPAGATIGYNLSLSKGQKPGTAGARLEAPALGLTRDELADGTTAYRVDLRLVSVRF